MFEFGELKTCSIRTSAEIYWHGIKIAEELDDQVQGFYSYGNKNIKFLPVNIHKNFPNLMALEASQCSIELLTKENLQGLSELKMLWLHHNQIEEIRSDTFQGLVSLEWIHLGEKAKLFYILQLQ